MSRFTFVLHVSYIIVYPLHTHTHTHTKAELKIVKVLFWLVKLPKCIPLFNYFSWNWSQNARKKKKKTHTLYDYLLQNIWTVFHLQTLLSLMRARVFQGVKLTHLESQWFLQELERRLTANTHTRGAFKEHKIKLWQWESEQWLSWQRKEPTTAEQSQKEKNRDKIDRWNWRKIKMFMAFSPSGLYLWLQIWFIFSLISLFPFPLPSPSLLVCLLASQPFLHTQCVWNIIDLIEQ